MNLLFDRKQEKKANIWKLSDQFSDLLKTYKEFYPHHDNTRLNCRKAFKSSLTLNIRELLANIYLFYS